MADSAVVLETSSNNLQVITMQSSSSQNLPAVSITADIQVDNILSLNNNNISSSSNIVRDDDKIKRELKDDEDNDGEPDSKKKKIDSKFKKNEIYDKLESRLGGILSCAVCLDLPKMAIFQCQMGHLMCASCFTHLLADGRLRDQVATCPNCRVEISKTSATRNLAVEKAVSELPSECIYCGEEFPNRTLMYHQDLYCEGRPTNCQFSRIGCQWRGPVHEAPNHELNCAHPKKTCADVMSALEVKDKEFIEEKKIFSLLVDLLSYEKIIFNAEEVTSRNLYFQKLIQKRNSEDFFKFRREYSDTFYILDLQLKPYRTDEYVHKLYYETSKFSAFNHQWVVKARINNSQRDPHTSNERQITYQLLLKTKTSCPLYIHYLAVKGPFSDIKLNPQIYKKCFTDEENESEYFVFPLPDSSECNRLLAAKTINFRLIMFLLSK